MRHVDFIQKFLFNAVSGVVAGLICGASLASDLAAEHAGDDLRYPKCLEVTIIDDCSRARITGACFKLANSCEYKVEYMFSYPQKGRTRYDWGSLGGLTAGSPPLGFLMPARYGSDRVIFRGGCSATDKGCVDRLVEKSRR